MTDSQSKPITAESPLDTDGRHSSVAHFDPLFAYGHLPTRLAAVSAPFAMLAGTLLSLLQDGPELTTALRKLLEAKDAAVRQAVIDTRK